MTDKESDEVKIGDETGRPLNSLWFNTVLQSALEDDLRIRREKGMGISLGDQQADSLSNLRFADDVLLFSTSLNQLKKMMFKRSTEKERLVIHPDKTKIIGK